MISTTVKAVAAAIPIAATVSTTARSRPRLRPPLIGDGSAAVTLLVLEARAAPARVVAADLRATGRVAGSRLGPGGEGPRSEEHTSELQSHVNLVCRLL